MTTESGMYLQIAAIAETWASTPAIPAAIPLAIAMTLCFSNPGAMEHAGKQWQEQGAKPMSQASDDIKSLRDGVTPEKWQSKDREAFDEAVDNHNDELAKASDFAHTVGTVLTGMSYAYFAINILSAAIGTFLLASAIAIWASTIFAPVLMAAANAVCGVFNAVFDTSAMTLKSAVTMAASIVGAGMAVYFKVKGDDETSPNFEKATYRQAAINPEAAPA